MSVVSHQFSCLIRWLVGDECFNSSHMNIAYAYSYAYCIKHFYGTHSFCLISPQSHISHKYQTSKLTRSKTEYIWKNGEELENHSFRNQSSKWWMQHLVKYESFPIIPTPKRLHWMCTFGLTGQCFGHSQLYTNYSYKEFSMLT